MATVRFGDHAPSTLSSRPGETRRETARVARLPLDFIDKVDRLMKLLDNIEVLLDDILVDVLGPRRQPRHANTGRENDDGRTPVTAIRHTPDWISKVVARDRGDGVFIVSIGAFRFQLPPYLAALLLALAEDTGSSPDEGVGFKPLGDLAIRISKHTGNRPLPDETINKYVYRLRTVLVRHAGLTRDAIQTHRAYGRRLAVRRDIHLCSDTDHSGEGDRSTD